MRVPITTFTSRCVLLPADDVDTDQIIPARFLTTTQRTGLGEHLFRDWRYTSDGRPNPEFPLNRAAADGAEILVVGRNFGCGSSREHAVWAIAGAGFRAVVGESFADIFRDNAIGNGLLPIQVDRIASQQLLSAPPAPLTVDLGAQTLSRGGKVLTHFPIAPFAKHCLMRGMDEMSFLVAADADISRYESRTT